ncbi:hypothetical protein H0H81_001377 [Sphagnurus paluster]|uniref:Uncharacterized protein n=1 Tax=Sphagnurus paluster TaxID=117069 RepID=A0A9P7GH73_9AGAR|nr:hypothetical protein H0H81_001377 [Sphagnurus paluster]
MLCVQMLNKVKIAAPACRRHSDTLADFEASIPNDTLAKWREQIEEWEREQWKPIQKAPNPFKSMTKTASERAVQLELAKEVEAQEAADASELSQEIHPSVMIANGLVIEDKQWEDFY